MNPVGLYRFFVVVFARFKNELKCTGNTQSPQWGLDNLHPPFESTSTLYDSGNVDGAFQWQLSMDKQSQLSLRASLAFCETTEMKETHSSRCNKQLSSWLAQSNHRADRIIWQHEKCKSNERLEARLISNWCTQTDRQQLNGGNASNRICDILELSLLNCNAFSYWFTFKQAK